MKSKKELFTLIAAVLAGLGAFAFLFLGVLGSELGTGTMNGLDVIFGQEVMGVKVWGFDIFALLAVVIGVAVCVLLVLTKLGKFNKDLTLVYVVALAVAAVLVFLTPTLIPYADGFEEMKEYLDLAFGGILSAICLLGSAALLAVNKWVIKE